MFKKRAPGTTKLIICFAAGLFTVLKSHGQFYQMTCLQSLNSPCASNGLLKVQGSRFIINKNQTAFEALQEHVFLIPHLLMSQAGSCHPEHTAGTGTPRTPPDKWDKWRAAALAGASINPMCAAAFPGGNIPSCDQGRSP